METEAWEEEVVGAEEEGLGAGAVGDEEAGVLLSKQREQDHKSYAKTEQHLSEGGKNECMGDET